MINQTEFENIFSESDVDAIITSLRARNFVVSEQVHPKDGLFEFNVNGALAAHHDRYAALRNAYIYATQN